MDLLIFTRQMSSMMRAGIPMLQALTGIQKSTDKPRLVAVLQALRDDLDKGLELSSAMARHPLCFSDFYVSMVRVGEGSGQLDTIFQRLFEQIEFDRNMKQKIKAALRYPTFVMIAVAIAVAIPQHLRDSGFRRRLCRHAGRAAVDHEAPNGELLLHGEVLVGGHRRSWRSRTTP
jgi:MSHA biogenesis protein MshG